MCAGGLNSVDREKTRKIPPYIYDTKILRSKILLCTIITIFFFFFLHTFRFPASGQAVVTGVVPSPPRFLPSIFIAHRVQQSHCSSYFSSSVANSRSRAFRKSICAQEQVPTNFYEYALGGARTLTKLTYTRLEDNLIRHRGDRWYYNRTIILTY